MLDVNVRISLPESGAVANVCTSSLATFAGLSKRATHSPVRRLYALWAVGPTTFFPFDLIDPVMTHPNYCRFLFEAHFLNHMRKLQASYVRASL